MDLQSLNIFIYVAELNSFTKAAEKLGFSQPTVSFQIKQLESELGAQLFDRIGHTIKLTDAGRNALNYAQKICNMSREMMEENIGNNNINGLVRLATADSLCSPLLSEWFLKFKRKFPDIALNIKTAGTGDLFNLIDRNEVDVVCTLDSHIYNTNYVILHEEPIGVHFVVSKDNYMANRESVNIEELISQPFLLTEKGMSYRRLMDETLAAQSLEVSPVLETGNADLICRLAEQGAGCAFLPDYATEAGVREGKLARLRVSDFEIDVWKQLFCHRDKWISPQMEAVMAFCEKL